MAKTSRKPISAHVERRLWAESAGKCMNPDCRADLFSSNGDIAERAHIVPYCESAENTFDNLILICPNCHTNFDKNSAFTADEVREWKSIRHAEIDRVFGKTFSSFDDLRKEAAPLLARNKSIYENYYMKDKRRLWDVFEKEIIVNNRKLCTMFESNLCLFQNHKDNSFSNQAAVRDFIDHAKEFEATRDETERQRSILFPEVINSIFGIQPIEGDLLPSAESLELLIEELDEQGRFIDVSLDAERPLLQMMENGKETVVYLDDTPRIRQMYHDAHCFRRAEMRLDSLIFALKYFHRCGKKATRKSKTNLREYIAKGKCFLFVYEYCLSYAELARLAPAEHTVVVNLHGWNGKQCISEEAKELAEQINVKLLDMDSFFPFVRKL